MIGERSNATGSKVFRELMIAGDMDGMLDIGIKQVKAGSHAIDINAAWAGRDEIEDIKKYFLLMLNKYLCLWLLTL